jgi:hypothetical protein
VRHPAGWCHATGPWPDLGTVNFMRYVRGIFFMGICHTCYWVVSAMNRT